jgi:tetratricopeptide (TPR) repeat protein
MLIFPKSERLELSFEGGRPEAIGRTLTVAGLLLLFVSLLPIRRRLLLAARRILDVRPVAGVISIVNRTDRWTPRFRRTALASAVVVFLVAIGAATFAAHTADADGTYRKAAAAYDAGRLSDALPIFQQARRLAPLSNTAIHSTYFEAIILFRQSRWLDAEKAFMRLLDTFPEAQAAAEAQYHVGVCRSRRGNKTEALVAWRTVQDRFPDTQWAAYARDRLREMATGAP